MCGRFDLNEKSGKVADFTDAMNEFQDWVPLYSVAPTEIIPIVRERVRSEGEVERVVEPAVWDFRPPFLGKPKRPQINARLESVAQLGIWKGAFAKSRCLVPMNGYFEWEALPDGKQPHFIHGEGVLTAAGIHTSRRDENDEWVRSVAIITREARDASGEVHDRMPVFLSADALAEWLAPVKLENDGQRDEMLALLERDSTEVAATMRSHPVSRRVNNQRTLDPHDPTLIDPITPPVE